MTFYLVDDGTMDTVVQCSECGECERFNFGSGDYDDDYTYDEFVEDCIDNAQETHECNEDQWQ